MESVGADLFEESGRHFLAAVDRYSGWAIVHRLLSLKTSAVTDCLERWFLEFGYPRRIRTDGGPQFRGEFRRYCDKHGITHEVSSPYNPQANGLAEAAVKSMKRLVQKCRPSELAVAVSEWRNSPRADGVSPSDLFLGRRMRGKLPCIAQPGFDVAAAEAKRRETRRRSREKNDQHSRTGLEFVPGQTVYIQDPVSKLWDETAVVTAVRSSGRSYELRKATGSVTIRSGRFMRPKT